MSVKLKYNISEWKKLGVNYWGITKAGNTSVKYALIANTKQNTPEVTDVSQWVHNKDYVDYITRGKALTNGLINFTVTRNPYDRAISMFNDFKRRRDGIFKHLGDHSIKTFDDFLNWLDTIPNERRDTHFKTQISFLLENGGIPNIMIFDINKSQEITEKLGIEIPHLNQIKSEVVLTNKQIQLINKIYKLDFIFLNYVYRDYNKQ